MRTVGALLLTLTLAACTASAPPVSGPAPVRAVRAVTVTPAEQDAVADLLAERGRAVVAGDGAAWSRTGTGPGAQPELFDRLTALRPARWTYRATRVTKQPDGTLAVAASLTYRLARHGPDVVREQQLTVSRQPGGWRVSAVRPPAPQQAVDLWDLGDLERRDGARCMVIGAPVRRESIRSLAAGCTAAAGRVEAALSTRLPGRTVMVVPADIAALARLLNRSSTAGLDGTAAQTVGLRLRPAESVLVNPDALGRLRPIGRRVVLTHELVHVAVREHQTHELPTWLSEGLADEIAYRGTGLRPETIAGPALDAARAGRYPSTLPAPGDFDAAGPDPALAYARAWSAADTVAARAGLPGLVELTRAVAGGRPLDAALRDVLNVDVAGFLPLWREHLGRLAR